MIFEVETTLRDTAFCGDDAFAAVETLPIDIG